LLIKKENELKEATETVKGLKSPGAKWGLAARSEMVVVRKDAAILFIAL
jgi:hypothetical protein